MIRFRSDDLLAVFVALDALLVGQLFASIGQPLAGVVVAVAVAGFWVMYQGSHLPRRRAVILAGLLILLFLLPQALLIAIRPGLPPVNDGVPMTEAAAGRLLAGLDPYGHDYIDDGTTRAFFFSDQPVDFAFRHYVYPPVTILLAVPGRLAGFGFSWMWLPGLAALAMAAYGLGRSASESQAMAVAVALNPLLLLDYLSMFNDLFYLAALLGSLACLRHRRPLAAGVLLGVALATKQQVLLLLPLVAVAAWRELGGGQQVRLAGATAVTAAALIIPFLAWNPGAFGADAGGYSYGSGVDSFPIRGFGLPAQLLRVGTVPNRWAPFPATAAQAVLVLPVLVLAWLDLRRWSGGGWWIRGWLWSAALAFAVFFGGRYFAPNYLTLVLLLVTLGLASKLSYRPPAGAPEGVDGTLGDRRVEGI